MPPPPGGDRAPPRPAGWPSAYLQVVEVHRGDLRVQEVFVGVELSDDVVHGRQPLVLIHRRYTPASLATETGSGASLATEAGGGTGCGGGGEGEANPAPVGSQVGFSWTN